ncbi:hypothetical protein BJ322DRAFT_225106 [Thelephora terrestris]|uniref:MYND-type domain-containing protein n=1 Tax=Thelephora terrestris TaxID=56493 RepID=A0A9P6H9V4_9AGAM|nr:hypothetical protein BJ322DRAFT_225106 [Thelephora terrestris]
MALPTLWSKKILRPFGNTSPIPLTAHLPLEEDAHILCLTCSDLRHILYSIYCCNSASIPRKLDITCCDNEPAVLARNVILLTMIIDMASSDDLSKIWNAFYHLYLDSDSSAFLSSQCRKLSQLSSSIETWNQSQYGVFIRMCDVRTLSELRRHWDLCVAYADSSESKGRHAAQVKLTVKETLRKYTDPVHLGTMRSAGYYWLNAFKIMPPSFTHFWKTGTTFTDRQEIENAKFLNPTFLFSAHDEGFAIDQESDPMAAFHLATAFKDKEEPVAIDVVFDCAKTQFQAWCAAFRAYISKSPDGLTIRFFSGDPLAFCTALRSRLDSGSLVARTFTRTWSTCPLTLDGGDYDDVQNGPPLQFNVVETSSLMDSVSLLNLLVAVVPLISPSPSSAVFTETPASPEVDALKWFTSHFCGDIPTICLIFDLVPTTYLSRMSTRSDRGGILASRAQKETVGRYYERLVWKRPSAADSALIRTPNRPLLSFDINQLAQLLLNVYREMFALDNPKLASSVPSLPRYTRESFALFLRILRSVVDVDWQFLMDCFYDVLDADVSLLMGSNYYQDLWCQLHRYQLYTVSIMERPPRPAGLYTGWKAVPPVVTVFLVVPRSSLKPLENADHVEHMTPILHCDVKSPSVHNIYPSITAAFGSIRRTYKGGNPWVFWEEDPLGFSGKSPLVVSFNAPAWTLDRTLSVALSLRATPYTLPWTRKLGIGLHLFLTKITDTSNVFIVPDHPTLPQQRGLLGVSTSQQRVEVHLDRGCRKISTLTSRIDLVEAKEKEMLLEGSAVSSSQSSSCAIRVSFGGIQRDALFPFPVAGGQSKLRIARKSSYLEVVSLIKGPEDFKALTAVPFPIAVTESGVLSPWSLPRLNIDLLPHLDVEGLPQLHTLFAHLHMESADQERHAENKGRFDDILGVRHTIRSIFASFTGAGGTANYAFGFLRADDRKIDTFIFVTGLRLDLADHSIVADAFVLTPAEDLMLAGGIKALDAIEESPLQKITLVEEELRVWKQLLPALAERCRVGWKHGANCEYLSQGGISPHLGLSLDPLCCCGRGKETEEFLKRPEWLPFAPFVTRIALSPLFEVPYLDKVLSHVKPVVEEGKRRCDVCKEGGKPKLLTCTRCKRGTYCSAVCQRADWKEHKAKCKTG